MDIQLAEVRQSLAQLAHNVAPYEDMAILGEGNVSAKINSERFVIKASGTQLSTLTENQIVEVNTSVVLDAIKAGDFDDQQIEDLLMDCRVDQDSLKPSVETLFHALLLELPGVTHVGHTHPTYVNQLLCSDRAKDFAEKRLFPDHIVYCGHQSVLIPYVDPGMVLARRIAADVQAFRDKFGSVPKNILLENHGLIVLGGSAKQVEAGLFMAEKSAKVFAGAAAFGGPKFLPDEHVERIAGRMDEHYRQRMLENS